jgi:hypothetical protein
MACPTELPVVGPRRRRRPRPPLQRRRRRRPELGRRLGGRRSGDASGTRKLTARGRRPSKGFGRFVWRHKPAAPGRRAACSGLWRGLSWRLVMAACHGGTGIAARPQHRRPVHSVGCMAVWCVSRLKAYSCAVCARADPRVAAIPVSPRKARAMRIGTTHNCPKTKPPRVRAALGPGQKRSLARSLGHAASRQRQAASRGPGAAEVSPARPRAGFQSSRPNGPATTLSSAPAPAPARDGGVALWCARTCASTIGETRPCDGFMWR